MTAGLPIHGLTAPGVIDGDYAVEVVGGRVIGLVDAASGGTRWEVWVAGNPADALRTPDGTDWVYVEVSA